MSERVCDSPIRSHTPQGDPSMSIDDNKTQVLAERGSLQDTWQVLEAPLLGQASVKFIDPPMA